MHTQFFIKHARTDTQGVNGLKVQGPYAYLSNFIHDMADCPCFHSLPTLPVPQK